MSRSERLYRTMLLAYPAEHRRRYGEPMAQLFRDRLRRDGGGLGTVRVWASVGPDLVGSVFIERLETAMNVQTWTNRWWEATVLVFAFAQTIMGVGVLAFGDGSHIRFGIGWGLLPAALLLGGLAVRRRRRGLATSMIIVGSLGAAFAFWLIYPIILAVIVIAGGLGSGKIGRTRVLEPVSA
ncbi:MAG: hypothetical protein BMS9Abin07_0612 [Acidimicrobiia bacterium]|nr:MAG: hypothetical protein BMS9Abin07_0612 [Acidimicrobiia bacterium]